MPRVRVVFAALIFVCILTVLGSAQFPISENETSKNSQPAAPEPDPIEGDPVTKPDIPETKRNWQLTRGATEINFEGGYSPVQPTFFSGRKEYDTRGRKFAMVSFRYGRVIGTVKGVTYEYMFEVMPYSLALKNEIWDSEKGAGTSSESARATVRQNTYAFGIEPAIFRFIFRPRQRLKPYVQTGAGFLFTAKPVPVPRTPRYNFIGDFGGGMMFNLTERRVMNIGYRYFHISNMNIGEINPGYNANVVQVGFSWFSK